MKRGTFGSRKNQLDHINFLKATTPYRDYYTEKYYTSNTVPGLDHSNDAKFAKMTRRHYNILKNSEDSIFIKFEGEENKTYSACDLHIFSECIDMAYLESLRTLYYVHIPTLEPADLTIYVRKIILTHYYYLNKLICEYIKLRYSKTFCALLYGIPSSDSLLANITSSPYNLGSRTIEDTSLIKIILYEHLPYLLNIIGGPFCIVGDYRYKNYTCSSVPTRYLLISNEMGTTNIKNKDYYSILNHRVDMAINFIKINKIERDVDKVKVNTRGEDYTDNHISNDHFVTICQEIQKLQF